MKRRAIVVSNDLESAAIAYAAVKKVFRGETVIVGDFEGACNLVKCQTVKTELLVASIPAMGVNAKLFVTGCRKAFPDTKVIVVSSNGEDFRQKALACGVFTYLRGPVDMDEMRRAIASALLCDTPEEARRL